MQHYPETEWQPLMIVALIGALVIAAGIVLAIIQLVVSIRQRDTSRDETGDPWNGRTLEWSIPSPAPAWNFAVLPEVDGRDAFWAEKRRTRPHQEQSRPLAPIEMPRNSMIGVVIAFFAVILGFALVWHIWWMAAAGLGGIVAAGLARAWVPVTSDEISAAALVDRVSREGAPA
jgi:cytochrome o ubiquinol oxidase subunit 1